MGKFRRCLSVVSFSTLAIVLLRPALAPAAGGPPGSAIAQRVHEPTHASFSPPGGSHQPGSIRSTIECVTHPSEAENVVLDCRSEYAFPNRETSLAVDPEDPRHLVEASMDRPFGDQAVEFATSFDGGSTWTIGDIPHDEDLQSFDPWVSFDVKHGLVLISYQNLGANANYCPPPGGQFVVTSTDGGLHWNDPVEVFANQGCPEDPDSDFFGEGKVVTDDSPTSANFGRSWLMGNFETCVAGVCTFPAGESHSDDGGV